MLSLAFILMPVTPPANPGDTSMRMKGEFLVGVEEERNA
jgi:hypothetical protein